MYYIFICSFLWDLPLKNLFGFVTCTQFWFLVPKKVFWIQKMKTSLAIFICSKNEHNGIFVKNQKYVGGPTHSTLCLYLPWPNISLSLHTYQLTKLSLSPESLHTLFFGIKTTTTTTPVISLFVLGKKCLFSLLGMINFSLLVEFNIGLVFFLLALSWLSLVVVNPGCGCDCGFGGGCGFWFGFWLSFSCGCGCGCVFSCNWVYW